MATNRLYPHLGPDAPPVVRLVNDIAVVALEMVGPPDHGRVQRAQEYAETETREAAVKAAIDTDEYRAYRRAWDRYENAIARHEAATKEFQSVREQRRAAIEADAVDGELLHRLAVQEQDAQRREQSTRNDLPSFKGPLFEAYTALRKKAASIAREHLTARNVELIRNRDALRDAVVRSIRASLLESFVREEIAQRYFSARFYEGHFVGQVMDRASGPAPGDYVPPQPVPTEPRILMERIDGTDMPALREPGAQVVKRDADGRPVHVAVPPPPPVRNWTPTRPTQVPVESEYTDSLGNVHQVVEYKQPAE